MNLINRNAIYVNHFPQVIAGCSMAEISSVPREPVSSFEPGTGMLTASARELLDPRDQPVSAPSQPMFNVPTQPVFTYPLPTPSQSIFGGEPAQVSFSQPSSVFGPSSLYFSVPAPIHTQTRPTLDPQIMQKVSY